MKLFKRSTKEGSPYYVRYWEKLRNGQSKQRWTSTGSAEKSVAKQIAAKIVSDAALRQHGVIDPDQERYQTEAKRTIEDHLKDFTPRLESRYTGVKAKINVVGQLNYIRAFAAYAKIQTSGEINADMMNRYIVHLADAGKSSRTIGAMIGACKHFTSWLRIHRKIRLDPLETIERPDPDSDRRLNRRMLLPTEWKWLIQGAMKAGERYGMTAQERCLAYRVAIQTGLRAGELRSLKRGSFNLDDKQPHVRADSGTTKNRQTAYQYIERELANDLRPFLATKLPTTPVFNLPKKEAAKMLQADLSDARTLWLAECKKDPTERAKRELSDFLKPTNESGYALDFHSLRHTCGAWLAIRGVQPKIIQAVMRHSTITLTLDTYGHLLEGAQSAAIDSAGELTSVPQLLRATGTTDSVPKLATISATKQGACSVPGIASYCESGENEVEIENDKSRDFLSENAAFCDGLHLCSVAEDKGFEPSTGFPAPDFESGSNAQKGNKNKGTRKPALNVLLEGKFSVAIRAIMESRLELERLIDQTAANDKCTLGVLRTIVSELRSAQARLEELR